MSELRNGAGETTQIGYINRNRQRCLGTRGVRGNHRNARAFKMECLNPRCGAIYGANGCDVAGRQCPECSGGKPSIEF